MTKEDPRVEAAAKVAAAQVAKYNDPLAASSGHVSVAHSVNAVSTGSLAWDYMSGIGGNPMGTAIEVFGTPSIGKSTIGFGTLRDAQAQGMLTGIIALEAYSDRDEAWMEKHGINLDYNVIARCDSGDDAFATLHDWVYGGVVDYIMFDSIGGISSEKEQNSDKPQAFGNAAMISWGANRVVQRAWKNNVGIMYINQVRDDTKSRHAGVLSSPGGWALKHAAKVRTQLKPGKDVYKIKFNDGFESVDQVVGRQIIASFRKNKVSESLDKQARFDFYHIDHPDYPFGVDVGKDIETAAVLAGVFEKRGSWFYSDLLPGGKINSKDKLRAWVLENPDKLPDIRDATLKIMKSEVKAIKKD